MRIRPHHGVLLLTLAACASRGAEWGSLRPVHDVPPRSAALARLTVENRTDRPLAIVYRLATGRGAEVEVGSVAAYSSAEVAPIPAGEPIILLARTEAGAELRLAPRSFELSDAWTWVIPADAAFTTPPSAAS